MDLWRLRRPSRRKQTGDSGELMVWLPPGKPPRLSFSLAAIRGRLLGDELAVQVTNALDGTLIHCPSACHRILVP